MSFPVLALFTRQLRLDTRSWRVYAGRGALLFGLVIALIIAHVSSSLIAAPGLIFFRTVVYINLGFLSLAGLGMFASVITEEKEDQTLGLLRMTGLSPVSLILGKSTSRLVTIVLLLLVQFPLTLLAVGLGGVSGGQVVAAYATLIAHILFLSNLALLFSVICRRTGDAIALSFFVLAAFYLLGLGGPSLIKGLVTAGWITPTGQLARGGGRLLHAMSDASAFQRIDTILKSGFDKMPIGFQVASNMALALLFFLLAWVCFNYFTREFHEMAPPRMVPMGRASRWPRHGGVGRAWGNALMWKDFHFITGGIIAMVAKMLIMGTLFTAMAYGSTHYRRYFDLVGAGGLTRQEMGKVIMFISLAVLLSELLVYAVRVFSDEVKWKTLSQLMLLPRSVSEIAYPKLVGCLLALIPAASFFAVGAALAPKALQETAISFLQDPVQWQFAVQIPFFLYLAAYFSVVVRRGAATFVLGIAWVSNILLGMLASVLSGGGSGFVIFSLILLALIGLLHHSIGRQLERVAAE